MKLQAVMENLQRQQQARLQQEMEARQQQLAPLSEDQSRASCQAPPGPQPTSGAAPLPRASRDPPACEEPGEPESARIQRAQMAALAAMRAAAAGLSHSSSLEEEEEEEEEESRSSEEDPGGRIEGEEEEDEEEYPPEIDSEEEDEAMKGKWVGEDFEDDLGDEDEDDYDEEDEMGEEALGPGGAAHSSPGPPLLRKQPAPQQYRGEPSRISGGPERLSSGVSHQVLSQLQTPVLDHGDWTYEEQFKQLYELDGDPKRKEFLDDLFSFMQKRGEQTYHRVFLASFVQRRFAMKLRVCDLICACASPFLLFLERYMKYLYPYECEKRGLSNPNELQAAIHSNRREGRRQGFGSSIFTYSPSGTHSMLSSPKIQVPTLGLAVATNGNPVTPVPKIKKEEDAVIPIAVPTRLPVSLAGHSSVAAQAAAVQAAAAQAAVAAQAVALEQLREKLESGEPPEKKMALVTEEQQRLMQRAIQQNLLAMTTQLPMSIRINSQGRRSPENRQDSATNPATNGTNSISMSVEINGIVYTGVLFAQTPETLSSLNKGNANSGQNSSSSTTGTTSNSSGAGPTSDTMGLPSAATSTSTNASSP
ncbi:AT-rich interactive domain-containing protein 3A [Sceloporus undulatus]|uniref:AT-rich interactive domain-containing protein 3A n=1 Tax=Sceloporus undulatus TaxID=8520 RepID=UPI001C4AAE46|nr:AT-rich interactive domain-containing protein 3A [Sceloporus undulatus]